MTGYQRRGFTLAEMIVVLIILAVTAALTAPAFMRLLDNDVELTPMEELASLFRGARLASLERRVTVTLTLDPATGRYRADSAGTVGSGLLTEGALDMTNGLSLYSDSARVRFTFTPAGSAFGDSLSVRAGTEMAMVTVDSKNGMMRAEPR
jgi:prepilin-type N-terminal cleavage/methylation domain-containing protein